MKLAIKKIKWYSISIKEQSPTKWLTSEVYYKPTFIGQVTR